MAAGRQTAKQKKSWFVFLLDFFSIKNVEKVTCFFLSDWKTGFVFCRQPCGPTDEPGSAQAANFRCNVFRFFLFRINIFWGKTRQEQKGKRLQWRCELAVANINPPVVLPRITLSSGHENVRIQRKCLCWQGRKVYAFLCFFLSWPSCCTNRELFFRNRVLRKINAREHAKPRVPVAGKINNRGEPSVEVWNVDMVNLVWSARSVVHSVLARQNVKFLWTKKSVSTKNCKMCWRQFPEYLVCFTPSIATTPRLHTWGPLSYLHMPHTEWLCGVASGHLAAQRMTAIGNRQVAALIAN